MRSNITPWGAKGRSKSSPPSRARRRATLSLAYSPGVAEPCLAIQKNPEGRLQVHRQGEPGGGRFQRHRRTGPRQPRRPGRQAGHGRERGPLQALCRHRRLRHRARHRGSGRDHQGLPAAGADLRRHQPGGHQGAGVLLHRGEAEEDHEHPGLPRRPARHRHHLVGRPDQRPACWWTRRSRTSASWSTAPAPPPSPAPSWPSPWASSRTT